MGKNKRKHPDLDELIQRPWCYYCERDFDDLKILINHQKAKHYKCERCGRRLNTAGGLSVHMTQVHKESLTSIENALPNRAGLDVEIFGMEGVPEDIIQTHNQRVLQQFAQAEAERRAATGNPAPGSATAGGAAKKPKFESPTDLKKRLAEHKAKKAMEEAAATASGNGTPNAADGQASPVVFPGAQTPNLQQQSAFAVPPPSSATSYGAPESPYGQPQTQHFTQQQNSAFSSQQPHPYASHGMPLNPHTQQSPRSFGSPIGQGFPPPPTSGLSQYHNAPQVTYPGGPTNGPVGQAPFSGPMQAYQPGSPQYPNNPSHSYGMGSSQAFQQPGYQAGRNDSMSTLPNLSNRQSNLPNTSGLPQRPTLGVPLVNAQQMQQLHQGHAPLSPNPSFPYNPTTGSAQNFNSPVNHSDTILPSSNGASNPNASSLDELVSQASVNANKTVVEGTHNTPSLEASNAVDDKKGKKEKDKATKMIYSDNEISPEEKMAKMPRYAFVPVA